MWQSKFRRSSVCSESLILGELSATLTLGLLQGCPSLGMNPL
jgi:hypothetical protein